MRVSARALEAIAREMLGIDPEKRHQVKTYDICILSSVKYNFIMVWRTRARQEHYPSTVLCIVHAKRMTDVLENQRMTQDGTVKKRSVKTQHRFWTHSFLSTRSFLFDAQQSPLVLISFGTYFTHSKKTQKRTARL